TPLKPILDGIWMGYEWDMDGITNEGRYRNELSNRHKKESHHRLYGSGIAEGRVGDSWVQERVW
ncbi:MAG: hypothetical protein J5641_04215, partial [Bacteroidales bacterium]|nr:hypothetical protein [Bacteroidales bacterium]